MTKVTMPRAAGYVTRDTSQADMDPELPEGTELITTKQAEAYAAARVREALEETANNVLASDPLATRRGLAAAIRVSIPE